MDAIESISKSYRQFLSDIPSNYKETTIFDTVHLLRKVLL